MIQPPEGNLYGDRPSGNRGEERVRQHTGDDIEGVPDEEGLDAADAKDRLDADPEDQKNFTDPDREPGEDQAG